MVLFAILGNHMHAPTMECAKHKPFRCKFQRSCTKSSNSDDDTSVHLTSWIHPLLPSHKCHSCSLEFCHWIGRPSYAFYRNQFDRMRSMLPCHPRKWSSPKALRCIYKPIHCRTCHRMHNRNGIYDFPNTWLNQPWSWVRAQSIDLCSAHR